MLVCQFTVSFTTSELCCKYFSYNDIFFMTLGFHFLCYVYIMYGNNVTFTFRFGLSLWSICSIEFRFLWRKNYPIFFYVRITYEKTLQSCFVFVRHCDVCFIKSQLPYLFVQCSYVFYDVRVIFWYIWITYGNYVIKWSVFSYVCL